jgi:hypothetical protein
VFVYKGITDIQSVGADVDVVALGTKHVFEVGNNDISKAFDTLDDTAWQRVALSSARAKMTLYDKITKKNRTIQGAGVELTINFNAEISVSRLLFNPSSNSPLTIHSIEYWDGAAWQYVGETRPSLPYMANRPLRIYFDDDSREDKRINTDKLRVVIYQKHYNKRHYVIPRAHINNVDLWDKIVQETTQTGIVDSITQDRLDWISGWRLYLEAKEESEDRLEKSATKIKELPTEDIYRSTVNSMVESEEDINSTVALNIWGEPVKGSTDVEEVKAYEYMYGINKLDAEEAYFAQAGTYEKIYSTNGASVIALEHEADIPDETTIQYDVQLVEDGPYFPLLPDDATESLEILDIDLTTNRAAFRFPYTSTPVIYRNNEVLTVGDDYTIDASGITLNSGYPLDAIYSARYGVEETRIIVPELYNNGKLNLKQRDLYGFENGKYTGVLTENTTDVNGILSLRNPNGGFKIPYIDYEKVNSSNWSTVNNTWTDPLGSLPDYQPFTITINDIEVSDITDYRGGTNKLLRSYGVNNHRKEAIFLQDKLYLNQVLVPEDQATIRVQYNYLVEYVRLRVRVLKTNPLNLYITPRLYKYILKVKTG